MLNKVVLVGRLGRDPEVRYMTGENATAVARFNVAVNRRFKNADGGYDTDWPTVSVWGKKAEFVEKYFHKGDPIWVEGEIRTGSYTNKDGQKVYTTEVYATDVGFVPKSGGGESTASASSPEKNSADFVKVDDDFNEELPFN